MTLHSKINNLQRLSHETGRWSARRNREAFSERLCEKQFTSRRNWVTGLKFKAVRCDRNKMFEEIAERAFVVRFNADFSWTGRCTMVTAATA